MAHARGFALCTGLLALAMATGVVGKAAQEAEDEQVSGAADVGARDISRLGTFQERVRRGFFIAPVPLDLRGLDRDLVGYGSYIVNAQGACNDCHTNPPFLPGGDPFLGQPTRTNKAGYLAGGMAFGPFISRNLTPQGPRRRPAGLTFEQFRIVIRTGVDLEHRPPHVPSNENDLLQVMPWPVYRHMRRADLRAIYEYLRAIPSIPEVDDSSK